jgi:Holliday junction resolvasome RuvABC endonuclease subunit
MLLALDISTSCTGYCVFDDNTNMIKIGAIKLDKQKDFITKVEKVRDSLKEVCKEFDIKSIAIEENLQAFRPGLSSANTLMKLAQFNGTIQWVCYEIFRISPKKINVNSARKAVELKVDRKSDLSTKDQVLNWVKKELPDFDFPIRTLKSGRNKGQLRTCNESYDMADAYVIGRSYFII